MSRESFASVLSRFSLRQVMAYYHHAPAHEHKWKSFPKCPFCSGKDCAGVFPGKDGKVELFKCHHTGCSSGNVVVNAVGYVSLAEGLSDKRNGSDKLSPAAKRFLQIAGAWEEYEPKPRQAPVVEDEPAGQSTPEESAPWVTPSDEEAAAVVAMMPVGEGDDRRGLKVEDGGWTDRAPAEESSQDAAIPGGEAAKVEVAEAEPEAEQARPAARVQPADDSGETPAHLAVMAEAYSLMSLSDADARMLWEKRGLTPDAQVALGFVSSPRSNKELLGSLIGKHSQAALLDSGLFVKEKYGAATVPNSKFYGWGVTGKKVKVWQNGELIEKREYGWTYPVLIPYFDVDGRLIALRPHKDNPEGVLSYLYVPAYAAERKGAKARRNAENGERVPPAQNGLITEGEFKAAAVWQALGGRMSDPERVAVAALPGIQMIDTLWVDILDFLEDQFDPRATVSVVYDNEEHGDPKLPGYKDEKWKRFDAQVYARLLASKLRAEGYDGRVGMLPNEWRDAKGKADWDGALGRMMEGKG